MKKILAALCIAAIIINIYIGMFYDLSETDDKKTGNGGNGPDDIIIPANFTVKVPGRRLGDLAEYEYTLLAEMYSENKTSKEWEKYTITANGILFDEILPITEKKDGFNVKHSVLNFNEYTTAHFKLLLESSDSEDFTAEGDLSIERNEYTDLNEKKVIQTATNGHVEVDPLPRIPKRLYFDGTVRNYPNPNEEQEESLDEIIYMGNKILELNKNGSILRPIDSDYDWVSEWYTQRYNWTVEGAERVAGYNTLIINITSGFFQGFLPFYKKIWIANEVSFPVKIFTRTNTSYEDENSKFYIILEHERELKEKGFTKGSSEIPWDSCQAGAHFHKRHPIGEFNQWEYLPEAGSRYDQSSFNYKTDDAEQFALENSQGLKNYLNEYDDEVITWAAYDEIKDAKDKLDPNGRAGKYNWNLSFGYKPTMEEYFTARENARKYDIYPHWGFYVNISYNVTKEPGLDKYSETTKIINQGKYNWGNAPLSKPQIDDEILTLASSEEIFKLDSEIKDQIYSNIDGEIDFEDVTYGLVMGDVSTSSMPGMEIIETITGITMPTSRYSWTFQDGTVFRSGETFSAAVDVESGQLLYVLKITGSELYSIFNS